MLNKRPVFAVCILFITGVLIAGFLPASVRFQLIFFCFCQKLREVAVKTGRKITGLVRDAVGRF